MPPATLSAPPSPRRPDTRFERRLAEILEHATEVFYEKGYEGASMRDLSRSSGMSLAGLYYYFESKEKLLYLIHKNFFTTVAQQLSDRLEEVQEPEARVRAFILNHLDFFLANPKAMKVLAHEDDVLENELGAEIATLKRQYYHRCLDLVEAVKRQNACEFNTRVAVLSLFGTMNWLYTWYNPRIDPGAQDLAREVADIFLRGLRAPAAH